MQMAFEGEEGARTCFNVSAGAFEKRNIRQSSRGFFAASRRARKNAESVWLHSSASTPPSTMTLWLRCSCSKNRPRLSTAPDLGSTVPYTRRWMRACTSSPEHMLQGSRVTYRVLPGSR